MDHSCAVQEVPQSKTELNFANSEKKTARTGIWEFRVVECSRTGMLTAHSVFGVRFEILRFEHSALRFRVYAWP